jgi:hypothetical protein
MYATFIMKYTAVTMGTAISMLRRMFLPDTQQVNCVDNSLTDGGKVVSPKHLPRSTRYPSKRPWRPVGL